MIWQEKMKEFGGGDLAFLSEDGEALGFVIVGEPILLEGKFKGKPSEKIGCPVVTGDGFTLLVTGKRLARKIAKHEADFATKAFMAIRHGGQNDITTTYELQVIQDEAVTAALFEIRDRDFHPELIDEAVLAARSVMLQ